MSRTRASDEFQRRWNERLDQRDNPTPDWDRLLAIHAARCAICRSIARVKADLARLSTVEAGRSFQRPPTHWGAQASAILMNRRWLFVFGSIKARSSMRSPCSRFEPT